MTVDGGTDKKECTHCKRLMPKAKVLQMHVMADTYRCLHSAPCRAARVLPEEPVENNNPIITKRFNWLRNLIP